MNRLEKIFAESVYMLDSAQGYYLQYKRTTCENILRSLRCHELFIDYPNFFYKGFILILESSDIVIEKEGNEVYRNSYYNVSIRGFPDYLLIGL